MSRKTCFLIYVISLVAILVSYIINFTPVTKEITNIFIQMQNVYLASTAVLLSFIIKKHKHYFLIQLGLSVLTAIIIQIFVSHDPLLSLGLIYKICAYIVYIYLSIQIRYMI